MLENFKLQGQGLSLYSGIIWMSWNLIVWNAHVDKSTPEGPLWLSGAAVLVKVISMPCLKVRRLPNFWWMLDLTVIIKSSNKFPWWDLRGDQPNLYPGGLGNFLPWWQGNPGHCRRHDCQGSWRIPRTGCKPAHLPPRMTYDHAMNIYGSDKPDTRFWDAFTGLDKACKGSWFQVFRSPSCQGYCKNQADKYSRKDIDKLTEVAKTAWCQGFAQSRWRDGALFWTSR